MCPNTVVRDRTCVILLLQDIRNKIGEKPTGGRGFLKKLKYLARLCSVFLINLMCNVNVLCFVRFTENKLTQIGTDC